MAGAAIATLLLGGRGDEGSRAALDAPALAPPASAPSRPGGGDGGATFTEVWELVIRFSRSWSAADDTPGEDEAPPPPARERHRRRRTGAAQPTIDCGDDPLCPLVLPKAAQLRISVAGGWGRVSIDRQDVGITPLEVAVIPGRHWLTIRFADGTTRTMSVDLRSGEHRTLMLSAHEPRRRSDTIER